VKRVNLLLLLLLLLLLCRGLMSVLVNNIKELKAFNLIYQLLLLYKYVQLEVLPMFISTFVTTVCFTLSSVVFR